MDIYKAIRLLIRNFWLLFSLPLISAGLMFFLTKNETKEYVSKTVIYTGITSGHSIESQGRDRIDFFAVNASFDNMLNILKSKSVLEEVSLRLLAQNLMLGDSQPRYQSRETFNNLIEITPEKVWELVVKDDSEATLQNLKDLKNKDETNHLYKLINLTHRHYSIKALSKLNARRIQGSDLLEITYRADDPAIVFQTLILLIDVFFERQSSLKMSQTNTVVDYFKEQLELAWAKLDAEEKRLLKYNEDKKIINYFEQTKHVASQQESIDLAIQQALLDISSARSMLLRLENDIAERMNVNLKNQNILFLRNELVKVNERLERLTVERQNDQIIEKINRLLSEKQELEYSIRTTVDSLFRLEKNIDGIERDLLIESWHGNVLGLESASARFEVLTKRRIEYDTLYNYYAPVGANLNRMERTIGVYEREYLNILHNLGLAKLRQQNLELSSTMDILDEPYLPIESQPSKRKILIVLAFMIGFILPASTVFALEFLDSNIKNIRKAEEVSGLKVAAIFPNLANKKRSIDYEYIKSKSLDVLVRNLLLNKSREGDDAQPTICAVFSNQNGEGKTLLTTCLLKKLANFNINLLYLSYDEIHPEGFDFRKYQLDNCLMKVTTLNKLNVDWEGVEIADYDFIFIEIPGIIHNTYPLELFKSINLTYIVTRANRAWGYADTGALSDVLKMNPENPPQMLLNGVNIYEMENVLGDLPRRRSLLRRVMKNIIRQRFFERSKFRKSDVVEGRKTNKYRKFWLLLLLLAMLGVVTNKFGAKLINWPLIETEVTNKDIEQGIYAYPAPKHVEDVKKPELLPGEEFFQPKVTEPVTVERYYLVAGSFQNEDNAKKRFEQLKFIGNDPLMLETDKGLIPVAAGKYNTSEEAEIAKREFLKNEPRSGVWIKSVVELIE